MIRKDYCVIGAGRFGSSLINTLTKQGHSVMVIDSDRKRANDMATLVAYSSVLDSTNVEMLKDIGVLQMDHVFVAIGSNIETSIMTCAALIELGVTKITAKASTDRHEMVLRRMGVTDVVRPEKLTGRNTALRIINSTLNDVTFLSDKLSLIQITIDNSDFYGQELQELNLSGIMISAIKRKNTIVIPSADTMIMKDDVLVILTQPSNIKKVEKHFKKKAL